MIKQIEPTALYNCPSHIIVDVRSPSEFQTGHIENAINLPLFDDTERATVGTIYTKSGREAGLFSGLEIVGPKLSWFVKRIKALNPQHKPLIIYCWRGGMRSNSMAWLLVQAGHKVKVLKGGYKAFRSYIREDALKHGTFIVIGGMTGSGKTDTLTRLKEMGEQTIDLEALANHKGSVFGHLGQKTQPANEQFENNLWEQVRLVDDTRPVYIEDESRSIGKVSIPDPFYSKMQQSKMYMLKVNYADRIERLVKEYGCFSKEELEEDIIRLSKFTGEEMCRNATKAIKANHLDEAVDLILHYYDKKYLQCIEKKSSREIIPLEGCNGNSEENALRILQHSASPK